MGKVKKAATKGEAIATKAKTKRQGRRTQVGVRGLDTFATKGATHAGGTGGAAGECES